MAHGLVIGLGSGLVFTLLLLCFGRALYELLGGRGAPLAQALAYSQALFSGAVLVWLADTLASVLRGSGNTLAPALALVGAVLVQVPLSGALTLGWGPFPRMGISGAAVAYVIAFALASLAMAIGVWRGPLRPQRAHWRFEGRLFREILRVGAISCISALQTVLTAVILTGFVARFGTAALAGYGVGVRLELLQVPIVFAIAQALVVMVGTNIGGGQAERARAASCGRAPRWPHCSPAASDSRRRWAPDLWLGLFTGRGSRRAGRRARLSAHRRAGLRVLRTRPLSLLRLAGTGPPRLAPDRRLRAAVGGGGGRLDRLALAGRRAPGALRDHHPGARHLRHHGGRGPVAQGRVTAGVAAAAIDLYISHTRA